MKKYLLTITFVLLAACSINACALRNREQERSDAGFEAVRDDSSADVKKETAEAAVLAVYKNNDSFSKDTWKEPYAVFLKEISGLTDYKQSEFSLRDLDKDGIPELIIVRGDEVDGILTVYSYNSNVYKIGDYSDPKVGVAGFYISDNPKFPGLFNLWWGGGIEHYGYLTVKEEKLIYEYLWYIDRTGELPYQCDRSRDKELIKESIKVCGEGDQPASLLEMYPIDHDNIDEIMK